MQAAQQGVRREVAKIVVPHMRSHFVVQEGTLDGILEQDCNRSAYLRADYLRSDDG